MRMSETQHKAKGRPAGGISLVNIKLADLIAALGTDQLTVPIGRVWLEKNGISIAAPAPIRILAAQPTEEIQPKIEYKLTTFED